MARSFRRKATPSSDEGRFIASRIQDARRRGVTNREIATAFGINERTVRKIVAGETPGTRIFRVKMETPRPRQAASDYRADIEIAPGEIRTVNVRVPNLPTARGERRPATPFDVFRVPTMERVINAEARRLQRRYGYTESVTGKLVGLRPIMQRNPATRLVTITGRL